jgi:demethylmenaquinone methyltransferase/2-methoxy-6-polyprenyl-1,4-benzoquinol methylase/phosphoethanolamine N-methyltransferase
MKSLEHLPGDSYVADTEGHTIHSWARYYDMLVGIISLGRERKFRQAALDLVDLEPNMKILDVGCGTGSLAIAAKHRIGHDGMVVGIDPSSNMVNLAQEKAEKEQVDVAFQVGVIEEINFPENQFDLVVSSLMMHHLPDELKKDGLQEVYRVLKPNGILLIVELDPGTLSLASLIHGHSSQLSAELEYIRCYLESTDFGSVEHGNLKFKGFSYLKTKKSKSRIPPGG